MLHYSQGVVFNDLNSEGIRNFGSMDREQMMAKANGG